MSDDFKSVVEALTSKMLNKRLFVVIWRSFGDPELVKRTVEQHLQYMIGLEKRGVVFASGPFTPGLGSAIGDGLTIFRANSLDEAKAFANSDPFVLCGARGYDLHEWTIMEGRVGLEVRFSDKTNKVF